MQRRQGRSHEDRRHRRTGLIGSKVVAILRQGGHEVVAASQKSGVDVITGEGLKEVMAGAQVVIDLANSPSFEDKAVLAFFQAAGRNVVAAEAAAGIRHHIALSIVGTDRTPDNGYFRAKVAQEILIEASGIPYTIVRATQFMEFLGAIAASSVQGNTVRMSSSLFQPTAADDVAAMVADVALAAPRHGIIEIAGPDRAPFDEIVARYLKGIGDPRVVVRDPGPLLRRPGRGALAGAPRRGASRPHRSRPMAARRAGSGLIRPAISPHAIPAASAHRGRGNPRRGHAPRRRSRPV
jgi:uncharacterized protein YbjT (DUF2867 family)